MSHDCDGSGRMAESRPCPGCDHCDRIGVAIVRELEALGHTPHCARRIQWGDGVCECGAGKGAADVSS